MRRYDVLTFDCYGTLVDWERGIGDAFASAARATGSRSTGGAPGRLPRDRALVQAERYRSYRDVLALTARRVAERLGWRLAAGRETFLPESLPAWPAFPDTNDALRRLAEAGHRLAILSNVDDDLLAGPGAISTSLRVRGHRAAGGRLQAGARALRGRAQAHRRRALAARRPELRARHRSRAAARHPVGVDQSREPARGAERPTPSSPRWPRRGLARGGLRESAWESTGAVATGRTSRGARCW